MKKIIPLALAAAMFVPACAIAQNPNSAGQSYRQSFEEFRKSIHRDFNNFRSRILEHYADFLRGEWHEYEPLMPQERYSKPKPKAAPRIAAKEAADSAGTVTIIDAEETTTSSLAIAPGLNGLIPAPAHAAAFPSRAVRLSDPQPSYAFLPALAGRPYDLSGKTHRQKSHDRFLFYTLAVKVPHVKYNVKKTLVKTAEYADQWTSLCRQNVAKNVIPSLQKIAKDAGLNDYFTYRLVHDYVLSKTPDADNTSRVSLIHYLLTNMGYDVRMSLALPANVPILMLPTNQQVYGKISMVFENDKSKKYYLFLPDGVSNKEITGNTLHTCMLPAEASQGKTFDLVINELHIPMKPRPFELSYGKLQLTGELNENIIPMLYRYPQMQMDAYARSNVQPKLRSDLTRQIKEQLGDPCDGSDVEELLQFTQHAFDYSTDQEYHGFEKPYFLEESLYFPRNDCEDRAIFYSYFLHNALGKKAQLIQYPGHEAATVKLDEADGTAYMINGEKFYISDPTYIGAHTGQVIPDYKNEIPNVDYTY